MDDMRIGNVEVLYDSYDKNSGKWVKEFLFNFEDDHIKFVVYIISSDRKYWQPTENNVRFADHSFERELESDLVYSLRTGDEEEAASILRILKWLDGIRENVDYLIPQLLELEEDETTEDDDE